MNSYTLELSSPDTNYSTINSEITLQDHTNVILDLTGLNEKVLPIYLILDWGDGVSETYDNNVYVQGRDNINIFRYSPVLTTEYQHQYYPSNSCLYKKLSAQILVKYSNGDQNWIVQPFKIRTYDYFEAVGDLELLNTNILPLSSNSVEHQLKTDVGGFTVELNG